MVQRYGALAALEQRLFGYPGIIGVFTVRTLLMPMARNWRAFNVGKLNAVAWQLEAKATLLVSTQVDDGRESLEDAVQCRVHHRKGGYTQCTLEEVMALITAKHPRPPRLIVLKRGAVPSDSSTPPK